MVDVGKTVVSGQPLMQIDITDYMHAITTQSENVAAARARSDQAAADELRYRGLVRTGAVSASTYDQIKAAADSAQAQLAAAGAQETPKSRRPPAPDSPSTSRVTRTAHSH